MANSMIYIACFTFGVFCFVQTAQALSIIPRPECGPVCAIACPCGKKVDYRGCPICSCKTCKPSTFPWIRRCPPVCAIYCPCGNKLSTTGCPTCTCNPCDQIQSLY